MGEPPTNRLDHYNRSHHHHHKRLYTSVVVLATHVATSRVLCTTTRFAREASQVGIPLEVLYINASADASPARLESDVTALRGALPHTSAVTVSSPWDRASSLGAVGLERARRLIELYQAWLPFSKSNLDGDRFMGALSFFFPAMHQLFWFEERAEILHEDAKVWFLEWDVAYSGHFGLFLHDHDRLLDSVDFLTTRTPWGVDFDDEDLPKDTTRWLFWGTTRNFPTDRILEPSELVSGPLEGQLEAGSTELFLPTRGFANIPAASGEKASLVVAMRLSSRLCRLLIRDYLRKGTIAHAETFIVGSPYFSRISLLPKATACSRAANCSSSSILEFHSSIGNAEIGDKGDDYLLAVENCRQQRANVGDEVLATDRACHQLWHAVKDPKYIEGECGVPIYDLSEVADNTEWRAMRHSRLEESKQKLDDFTAETKKRCRDIAQAKKHSWC